MATITNLYIDQGTDFFSLINLTNQDGSPLDLTGYSVNSQFRKSYQSSFFIDFQAQVYNPTEGVVSLTLAHNVTSGIAAGRYLFDLELTSPTNIRSRALEGIVILSPEITR